MIDKEEVFVFLDDLRTAGFINMFGATPYVQGAFGVKKMEARELVVEWMRTFAERHQNDAG